MFFSDIELSDFSFTDTFLYIQKGDTRRWIALSEVTEIRYDGWEKKLYVHYNEDD